ncbi:flavin reductase family protein [Micromonospora sp. NPDC051543]|uniref:flavin reductase family protein n=1 Tax=Micromonospora sp. NPDC051543 TaxID=3364287 RepID=UPI0037BDF022
MNSDAIPDPDLTDVVTLRRAFGTFATGVTVVTVGGELVHGMTANSFTSVSLEPPLVLVCVERQAVMHRSLMGVGTFGVSVLAADQEHIARYFASRGRPLGPAQFDEVDWRPGRVTGAPLLDGALTRFECRLLRCYDGGDHSIFLGAVLSLERCVDAEALLFLNGRFHRATSATDVDLHRREVRT